jgi:adenylate cyclase
MVRAREFATVSLDRLGDAEFVQMLNWHDRLVRDSAEEHRGFVVKSQGDGSMLTFPSAAYVLRASLVLRNRLAVGFHGLPIRVRIGLHVGEAMRHADDFYGRASLGARGVGHYPDGRRAARTIALPAAMSQLAVVAVGLRCCFSLPTPAGIHRASASH